MRILVLVPGYLPGFKSGGPIRTVENMINALGDSHEFSVICADRDLGDSQCYEGVVPNGWSRIGRALVLHLAPGIGGYWRLLKIIRSSDFDVMHINSFFSFKYGIYPVLLSKLLDGRSKTIILGPRGEFSKGALSIKALKKRLFIFLSKITGLHSRVVWHASSPHERDDICNVIGDRAKVRVAQDIAIPPRARPLEIRSTADPLRIIFISRISPKKNLAGAISILKRVTAPVHFSIYGPIEDEAYWTKCRDELSRLPSNISVTYGGTLHPDAVSAALSEHDLFLFPTYGENFGHVIAEALFSGVPVLVSDQTPWRNLEALGLGWDLPLSDTSGFSERIEACSRLEPAGYLEWRRRVQQWARLNIVSEDVLADNQALFDNLE